MRSFLITAAVILAVLVVVSFSDSLEVLPSSVVDPVLVGLVLVAGVILFFFRRRASQRRQSRRKAIIERLDHIRARPRPPEEGLVRR